MPVWSIPIAPLLTALLCCAGPTPLMIASTSILGAVATLGICASTAASVLAAGPMTGPGFHLDALGAYMASIVALLSVAASMASHDFMKREAASGNPGIRSWRIYYGLLHLFMASMLLVPISNNLGLMWIAMEATTLSSAFLVGWHRHNHAVEAAWKYVLLCTVGIAFALFGTILLFYAGSQAGNTHSLDWTSLLEAAPRLNHRLVKLAFLFALLGYGTKAGLSPMHAWLPDAHSQAPSPVSALLSGVLIKCALYAILRFHIITSQAVGPLFSSRLLLALGLLSLVVAVPFILLQRDFKRLLAYCSVEHVGVIATGVGFGGFLGIYGALFHILNHALAKSLLFLTAGNIAAKYGTKHLHRVTGLIATAPLTAVLFLGGALALAGLPPFGLFVSEFCIVASGITAGYVAASVLFIALMAIIFGGLLYHVLPIAFGTARRHITKGDIQPMTLLPVAGAVLLLAVLGCWIPGPLDRWLTEMANIIQGKIHG